MKFNILNSFSAILVSIFMANAAPSDSVATKDSSMKTITVDKFVFSYKIDGPNLKASVSYPTTGWVAVGFDPKMVMKDAHIIIGSFVDGKPVVSEEYGTGMFSHKPVASVFGKTEMISSDCSILNGATTLSFIIPLESSTGKITKLAAGKETKVIFSAGETADMGKKHKFKTKKTIRF